MKNKFTFQTRQIVPFIFEVILTNQEGTKFGRLYQALAPMPNRYVFEAFMKEPKEFFIDVEVVSITAPKQLTA